MIAVAETLGGEWRDEHGQRYPRHRSQVPARPSSRPRRGRGQPAAVAAVPAARGDRGAALRAASRGRLLFVDLETTGLAGGAGTYAFLVGCAWFDGAASAPASSSCRASPPSARCSKRWPAIAAARGARRHLQRQVVRPAAHRDALPAASDDDAVCRRCRTSTCCTRRAVSGAADDEERASSGGCRLTTLEETLCGHVREGDVPGFEIPSRYFHFVRTGDARPLAAVIEHNRLDLLSLALLTAPRVAAARGRAAAARTAREALGLGRLYERAGMTGRGLRLLSARRRAAGRRRDAGGSVARVRRALAARAPLRGRRRPHGGASSSCAAARRRIVREATEALAVHHEHRAARPARRRVASRSQSLQCNSTGRGSRRSSTAWRVSIASSAQPIAAPMF